MHSWTVSLTLRNRPGERRWQDGMLQYASISSREEARSVRLWICHLKRMSMIWDSEESQWAGQFRYAMPV